MSILAGRPYTGDGDLPQMQLLLRACEPEASYDFHVQDLPEERELNTRLWEGADGTLVAMAAVYPPSWLSFVLHPRTASQTIETQIIDWANERASAHRQAEGEPIKLWSQARESDGKRIAMLVRHGFAQEGGGSLRMERPLDVPLPEPQLPAGFTVRTFGGRPDAVAWADMWNDTGPGRAMSVDQCLSWREPPDIVPELDLIAVAPDGTFAAYCMCSINQAENALTGRRDGWTDPIGTRPRCRRRGLARALILTALRGLKAKGCERALLGVDGANTGAIQLYESCGYRTLYRKVSYSKEIASA
jgi:mycothiol synthase